MREVVIWSPMTKGEADIVAASLRSIGIEAIVMGAMDRSYAPIGQVHVMVDAADAAEAREFIASNPNELEAEQLDGVFGISAARRRRAGLVLLAAYLVVPVALIVAAIVAVVTHW